VDDETLKQRITFIQEVDALKQVQRRSFVSGTRRLETSAEHSWHVALMALVLVKSTAPPEVDGDRVLRMLLLHDLAEIDAGDLLLYAGEEAHRRHKDEERKAADRLFGLLPEGEGVELRALWEEFEARATPDARFAAAIDRLQPLLLNFLAEGAAWRRHGITAPEVYAKNRHIVEGSEKLWNFAEALIDECVSRGYLKHHI
jgi:putative hydrolases of HD superfamily